MILLNGKPLEETDAAVLPSAEAARSGNGVFTTMRVTAGRVEFLNEHAKRLTGDVRVLGLKPGSELAVLRERCAQCVATNDIVNGGLKIVWFAEADGGTGELIAPRLHNYGPEAVARGFALMTLRCGVRETRELSRHKTLHYFEHAQAKKAAVAAGFDDALWIDERGRVLEGATTNVFAVFPDEIVTPETSAGLLPGVARGAVLRMQTGRPVRSVELTDARLAEAEALFVTNSLMGVMPVRAWDGRVYDLARSEITREIGAMWERAALGGTP